VRYSAYLLQRLHGVLNETIQQQYMNELLSSAQLLPSLGYSSLTADLTQALPLVKRITPLGYVVVSPADRRSCSWCVLMICYYALFCSPSSHLSPVRNTSNDSGSIWLYSPYQKRKEEQTVLWVENELAQVKIELANPTHLELEVQAISLRYAASK
jgi:hypothetical protein